MGPVYAQTFVQHPPVRSEPICRMTMQTMKTMLTSPSRFLLLSDAFQFASAVSRVRISVGRATFGDRCPAHHRVTCCRLLWRSSFRWPRFGNRHRRRGSRRSTVNRLNSACIRLDRRLYYDRVQLEQKFFWRRHVHALRKKEKVVAYWVAHLRQIYVGQ